MLLLRGSKNGVAKNTASASLPLANSDATAGYSVGSRWLYTAAYPVAEWLVCTDATAGAAKWIWEQSTKVLGRIRAPIVVPPSGSFANNGAYTAGTAVPRAYTRSWCYFAANVIGSGVPAGLYYTVWSDTTHATVYNNICTSCDTPIPTSPTPFVTTGPGSFTQTLSNPAVGWTVSAGTIGHYDRIRLRLLVESNATAGSKYARLHIDGAYSMFSSMGNSGASANGSAIYSIDGAGSGLQHVFSAYESYTPTSQAISTTAYDLTQQHVYGISYALGVATDVVAVLQASLLLERASGSIT